MASILFIGGGNMASALIAGLRKSGASGPSIAVVDPDAAQRARLQGSFGVQVLEAAGPSVAGSATVVWAVKPQYFQAAAAPCAPYFDSALHVSVMAGIRSDTLARALRSERVVRAMPNTPALIGQGIAGLYARAAATPADRAAVERLLSPTGQTLWMDREADLDAVTALSGSGPAYIFYVIEAMVRAGREMGLSDEQAKRLTTATLAGATSLAIASTQSPAELRAQVTSKGGTTHAAIVTLEQERVGEALVKAIRHAQRRAQELGDEFAD